MNYRLATILAREAVSVDKTYPIDLNLVDPVSQIQVVYESFGEGSGPPAALAAACVTKIELIDGSDVLYSLSGQEAQALDFYHRQKEPANENVYIGNTYAEMVFNMNFGRVLWDPILAFDPTKYKNPQLKITIDRDAGGQESTAGYLTVLAHIFDEKAVTPTGFLMQKEIKDYTLEDTSHEYTDLPTDFPYRKLLIKSLIPGTGAEDIFDTIKLSEDVDRKIPFNHTIKEILRGIVGQGPPYREKQLQTMGGTTKNLFITPAYRPVVNVTKWEVESQANTLTVMGGSGGRVTIYAEAVTTGVNLDVAGYCPHGVLEIPFGLQDDPADWYDVTKVGSVKLDILTASPGTGACQIFLQQHRSY